LDNDDSEFVAVLDESALQEGAMKMVDVDGTHVLLVKKDGQIYAIDDHCPHQGCAFSHGTLEGIVIICPCHEWHFNVKTGEYLADPEFKLTTYDCKVESGKIWVRVEDSTKP
jgi:nitrite reductase/ring-hydroxylating ferredoxin subunit